MRNTSDLLNFASKIGIAPMAWADSFDMYGERKPHRRHADASDYGNYHLFKACCKMCGNFTKEYRNSDDARMEHRMHCSRKHGYIFPTMPLALFQVSDRNLQDMIITCMQYDLALIPEYSMHDNCVRMQMEDKIVCVVHEGNEYGSKVWMDES